VEPKSSASPSVFSKYVYNNSSTRRIPTIHNATCARHGMTALVVVALSPSRALTALPARGRVGANQFCIAYWTPRNSYSV
jgi:hypothetical protein